MLKRTVAVLVMILAAEASAGSYRIRDLGVNIKPVAINNAGQVLALTPPVLSDDGSALITPGTLYRIEPDGSRVMIATGDVAGRDINNRGEVIGAINTPSPSAFIA